ncbi:MAG: DUF6263 family protein [Bacteroidota bacterium]
MQKRRVLLVLGLSLALAVSAAVSAAEGLTLRLRLTKGQTYRVTTVSEQRIKQTIFGFEQEMNQTIVIGYRVEVTAVDADGIMTMRFIYDTYRVRQESAGNVQEYDSARPDADAPPALQGYAALIGLGFDAKCDTLGRLVEISGLDEMIDGLLDRMNLPEGVDRDQLAETMRGQYGDEAMKRSMGMFFCQYPEAPLAVGDEWTQEMRVNQGIPMAVANTYTLAGRQGGLATLKVHSIIAPDGEDSAIEMSGMEIRLALAGEQEGTIELDEATGLTIRARLTQKVEGEMTLVGTDEVLEGGDPAQGEGSFSWPMTIEAVTTVEMS